MDGYPEEPWRKILAPFKGAVDLPALSRDWRQFGTIVEHVQ